MKDPQKILNGIQALLVELDSNFTEENVPIQVLKTFVKHTRLAFTKGDQVAARLYLVKVQEMQIMLASPTFQATAQKVLDVEAQEKRLKEIPGEQIGHCYLCHMPLDLLKDTYVKANAGYAHYSCIQRL